MPPKTLKVDNVAIISTRAIALRASAFSEMGHISIMTLFAADAEPDANGRMNATRMRTSQSGSNGLTFEY